MSLTIESAWPTWHDRLIFVDRCIPESLAPRLKVLGWDPIWIGDVYPDNGRFVEDIDWIAQCAKRNVPVLTRNVDIAAVREEFDAVRDHGAKLFVLDVKRPYNRALDQALVVGRHHFNMRNRVGRPGACFVELPPEAQPLSRLNETTFRRRRTRR